MHNWNDSLKGVLLGALTGIALGLGGFVLSEIPKTHAMGGVVFLLVPFAAGVAITLVSHNLERISAAVLLATVGSLAIFDRYENGNSCLRTDGVSIALLSVSLAGSGSDTCLDICFVNSREVMTLDLPRSSCW